MAGLADACSSVDDHAHPDRRSCLAAIYPRLQHQPFLSAVGYLLAHPRNPSPHPSALAPTGSVAWRTAGHRRCGDDFTAGLFHRLAGKLFHLALPAGDHCREHFVPAPYRISNCGDLSFAPCGDDYVCLRRQDPTNILHLADDREPSYLACHEPPRLSCGCLFGELASTVSSEEGRGTRREA